MRRHLEIAILWAAATAGAAACSTSISPIAVAAGCPEQPVRGPDEYDSEPADQLISDFEDGTTMLAMVGGRNGAWVLGTDGTDGTVIAANSGQCAARGVASGHFAGVGLTSWGANWTAVFKNNNGGNAVPYDGTAYSGVSFWAAVGSSAMAPFQIPMGITTIDNAWNGGVCTTECMDYYATTVTLTPTWQRVVLKFSDLAQGGWGVPQIAMRRDQLVGFIMWPTHQFDIWIDDVRFEP
jgi:hypothetical protein